MKKYDIEQLKLDLGCSIRSFCLHFFPNGRYYGEEYAVGSLNGEPGNSLKICITGEKAGMWKDFATNEGGNNLLDLLCKMRGGDFQAACKEASNWLNNPDHYGIKSQSFIYQVNGIEYSPKWITIFLWKQQKILQLKRHDFFDLTEGTYHDHAALSKLLGVNGDSLDLAVRDGVLRFFDHPVNGRCWSVMDKDHYVRQDRRLDGKPFVLRDESTAKARTLGIPSWPIGIPTDKNVILLCEGSSDFLAAYSLIHAENMESMVCPVTILGASNCLHPDAVSHFKNKYIFGSPDYDAAGIRGMTQWCKQLNNVAAGIEVFDYCHLKRDDGDSIKDLRDFLRVDVDQREQSTTVAYPISKFVSKIKGI